MKEDRPDPDILLKAILKEQEQKRGGRLRIFFGMSAGVGKTYSMLKAAHERVSEGIDVLVGTVDTHGRRETEALTQGLNAIPRKKMDYKGTTLFEMDLDAILERKPKLVLVDELAHTNAPGSRHSKRYQDVLEILDNDIDVYTTLNVQHLESRKEAVEQISQVPIRETVPDSILERASQIILVDITPEELLKRLHEGKVYLGERAEAARNNFFREGTLAALREIALRITAEKVDQDLQDYMRVKQIQGPWKTSERLMVAVSHSPYSERLIRATRRIAYNLEAQWIAVNIDTGVKLSELDQRQLMKNLALVRELGGELVTVTETDVSVALQRVARQRNITQIVIGRPTRRLVRDFLEGGSLLERLVRESGEFDVHVIRQDAPKRFGIFNLRNFTLHSRTGDFVHVATTLFVVAILSRIVLPLIGYKAVGFLFLLAVLGLSLFFSVGPILAAAVGSALIWDYFFIPPEMTFYIVEKDDLIMCAMYLMTALTTGWLTSRIRFHQKLLRDREAKTNLLYEVVSDIAKSYRKADMIALVCARVGLLLEGDCQILLKNSMGQLEPGSSNSRFELNEKKLAVASWVMRSGKRAGWSTETLSEAEALYLPLTGRTDTIGVFVYQPRSKKKFSIDREDLLAIVANQLAISLERESFEEKVREANRLKDSEKLHQTLLDSVSHEVRTPLTALINTARAALELVESSKREPLIHDLNVASERLNRVFENLLDMTRLNSGVMTLKKQWEDLADVLGVVLRKLDTQDHKMVIDIDKSLSLINIDFRLMEHVFSNIIYNSICYAPKGTTILVKAWPVGDRLRLTFEDEGPGVPQESLTQIFTKFYRVPGAPAGGTGLGLAIAKNIVELHGGSINAENKSSRGLKMTIELPLGVSPQVENE